MEQKRLLILVITLASFTFSIFVAFAVCFCRRRLRRRKGANASKDIESNFVSREADNKISSSKDDFMKFHGGEDLSIHEILEAPGEVIGKSSYGSLYKANLVKSDSIVLLRFLRPSCSLRVQELWPIVEFMGSIRHTNLVPLCAFYAGCRGEKLMVYPFYGYGNLSQFIRDGNVEAHKWPVIHRISIGIVKGLLHLHTFDKPIIHGNLKSKNILLDGAHNPYVSDFGLHLILNANSAQKMLEASAREGYKAPELIKMREATKESDIYSLGVIFLELITGGVEGFTKNDEDHCLPSMLRNAILEDRLVDLYRRDILVGLNDEQRALTEDSVLRFSQLGMACCSPSRLLRPELSRVLEVLEEIGGGK